MYRATRVAVVVLPVELISSAPLMRMMVEMILNQRVPNCTLFGGVKLTRPSEQNHAVRKRGAEEDFGTALLEVVCKPFRQEA